MSGLHHTLTMAFGVSGIVKEKGYFKTIDGTKMIRKTKDPMEQILAKRQISEHCITKGYPWMDRYYLAKNGQISVFAEGDQYIMTDLIRHKEADFTDDCEFLKVVGAAASWHSCAREISFAVPLQPGKSSVPLNETFRVQIESLEAINKRIRKQSKWTDFDVCTIKNYPEYSSRMQRALKLLESTGYIKRWNEAKAKNHICHGGFKEEVLNIRGGDVYITKLDSATVDYQLNDLCSLIRRREKKKKGDLKRGRILEAYMQISPLEPEEEVILEAMLLYPFAFVKLVTEYYHKKRTWTPVAMTNKMKEILTLDFA